MIEIDKIRNTVTAVALTGTVAFRTDVQLQQPWALPLGSLSVTVRLLMAVELSDLKVRNGCATI